MKSRSLADWSELNRDVWLDCVRIFLGIALFLKGVMVLKANATFANDLAMHHVPFAGPMLVYGAALAHFIGGTMLVFGVFTRAAALIQMPNVIGAILFVHSQQGIFSRDQDLELAILVLVLLVTFAFVGSGRLSTDWYFNEHPRTTSDERRELAERETNEEPSQLSAPYDDVRDSEISASPILEQHAEEEDDEDARDTLVDVRRTPPRAEQISRH